MSADGICVAITRNGTRCASPATDANGHCAHHARIARVMALAPKPATATAAATNATSSVASAIPTINNHQVNGYGAPAAPTPVDMSPLRDELASLAPMVASPSPNTTSAHAPQHTTTSSSSSTATTPTASTPLTPWPLPQESVLAAVNATFTFPASVGLPPLPGSLFITTFRLRFEPLTASLRSPGHMHRLLDDALEGLPRAAVAKLSYPQAASASRGHYTPPSQLVIRFKDLRSWTLGGEINTLMTTLNRFVFVDSPLSLQAFVPMPARPRAEEERELAGHRILDLHADFARMGVDLTRDGTYRVTEINRSYSICATYPQRLVVPAAVTDTEVATVAEFRSKGRLPICCFVHGRNTASIWRCAQPKRGILNAQNPTDERYLARIAASNRHQPKIWIADCRPELNARANNLTGGGTESSSMRHASVSFLNIANIHAMRESLDNVRALVMTTNADTDFSWLARVEDTKWLLHVRLVLSAAVRVADAIENKQTTVLVHCSDGWDRTGQLCGLSQLLLDRHYRTIEGFMQLIEKEWLLPGHKFHDRVGPGRGETEEQSPIFLQFLDCVWQLWRQYPTYFEFNPAFLESIADALFSGRFGTFLGNCDRERTTWNTATRTPSLWAHLLRHRGAFANPFYREHGERVLLPPMSSLLRNVELWSEYYARGAPIDSIPRGNTSPPMFGAARSQARTPQQDLGDALAAAMHKIQQLELQLTSIHGPGAHEGLASPSPATLAALSSTTPPPAPTPAAMPPVQATLHAYVPPPAALSHIASVPPSPTPVLKPIPARAPSPPPPGSWACAICSKINTLVSPKCVVCGRPPPPPAATTHL